MHMACASYLMPAQVVETEQKLHRVVLEHGDGDSDEHPAWNMTFMYGR
jgi:hypothetical protein